jgi:hypothetical protein
LMPCIGTTPYGDKTRASDQDKRAGQRVIMKKLSKVPNGGSER